MNTVKRKIPTDYGPDTRFEVVPTPVAPFRAEQESSFEQLKNRLLAARLDEIWAPEFNNLVRRAANEAAAVAWVTPYPLLFFPTLFEEKLNQGLSVAERQADIRQRSRDLLRV